MILIENINKLKRLLLESMYTYLCVLAIAMTQYVHRYSFVYIFIDSIKGYLSSVSVCIQYFQVAAKSLL